MKLVSKNLALILAVFAGAVAASEGKEDDRVYDANPKIFNGDDAYLLEFPYYTELATCGAQLIAPRVVLTAAHCDSSDNRNNVRIGAHVRDSNQYPVQFRSCLAWVNHPDYDPNSIVNGHDYALCYLNRPAQMAPNVTLTLNEDMSFPESGFLATAVGMGYSTFFFGLPGVLQKTDLSIIETEDCGSEAPSLGETTICTSESGTSTCGGDSGGPLVSIVDNGDGTETHTLIGLTSFGYGIFCSASITGFSRISAGIGWIKEVVCGNNVQASFCE